MKVLWMVSFSIMILFSCYGQKVEVCRKLISSQEKEIYTIDVYSAYKEMKDVLLLSKVVEEVEFIPLETTEACLLGGYLQDIVITKTDIIVYDYEKAHRFDRKGKFLNTIGKRGQGPGEYVKCMDITVDTVNQYVYFVDQNPRILKYDYNGAYLGSLSTDLGATMIERGKDDIFVIEERSYLFKKPKERYSIYFYSAKEKRMLSKMRCERQEKIPALAICNPLMYNYKDNLYVQDFWSDTIYQVVTPYLLSPHAVLRKGKFEERTRADKSLITGKEDPADKMVLGVYKEAETDRFIFIYTNKGLVVYDKKKKETTMGNFLNKTSWKDDLYGGPGVRFPRGCNENQLYTYTHSYEFKEVKSGTHSFSEEKYKSYRKMVDRLDSEGNPVIMILKIKE